MEESTLVSRLFFFFCRFGVAGLLDGEEPKNNSSKKRMDYLKDKSKVGISDDQK